MIVMIIKPCDFTKDHRILHLKGEFCAMWIISQFKKINLHASLIPEKIAYGFKYYNIYNLIDTFQFLKYSNCFLIQQNMLV